MRIIISVLFGLLLLGSTAFAQGNQINYGDTVLGTLDSNSPVGFYTFRGAAGDRVTIQVIGIGIDPAASLNAPNQQQLINNDNDAPGSTDAFISYNLPQNGIYSILVSSVTGDSGQFLIRLNGQPAPQGQALTNQPVLVDIAAGPQAQVFTMSADPAAPTTLSLSTPSPDFSFGAVIRDMNGRIIALVTASTAFNFTLPPGQGTYTVEVTPSDPARTGQVNIGLGEVAAVPAPLATEEADVPPAPVDAADVCMVAAQGSASVNVRSGAGTEFEVIGQLDPGTRVPVTGVMGTWYQIELPNIGTGWVRRDVVTGFGPCDIVPVLDENQQVAPPAMTEEEAPPPITPTYTPTFAQEGVAPPTYTPTQAQQLVEPTMTPTIVQEQTATYTPTTPVQSAPPDGNYALVIPLDSTTSVTDFVSYPEGDREDRVSWRVNGLNANAALSGGRARLVISVSCFGTGTDNITFSTGGQTYSCGQTIYDREVTFDSNTGSVTITAVGGDNTYVQWVVTGTANRIN
jgi:hypothetical protein